MRMPRGPKLDRLIRFPKEIDVFYHRVEQEGRLQEYLDALLELPESSVRDVRISRVLVRFGKINEAMELVGKHKKCPLAKSTYMGLLIKNCDEDTKRRVADNYKPWSVLGNNILNVEAQFNDFLTIGAAAHAIKRMKVAEEAYFDAIQVAKIMKNPMAHRTVFYNMAWSRLYDGQLITAASTFRQVMDMAHENMQVHEWSVEYLTWISWIENDLPYDLPEWAHQTLQAAQSGGVLPADVKAPASAGIPALLGVMRDVRELTREFHMRLPVLYVGQHRRIRDGLVEKVCKTVPEDVGEMLGFTSRSLVALAMSMQHNLEALNVLKSAFKWPTTGIPVMSMLYYAVLVQILANLPHAAMDNQEVKQALQLLSKQYHHLPAGQKTWLLSWMKDFTPVPLFLLSEAWKCYPPLHDYVVVTPQGVYRGAETVPKFPRFFMTREVENFLSGGKPDEANRMQSLRAFRALSALPDRPLVIYQPVVRRFENLLN